MVLDLYYLPGSPLCLAVQMTAEVIGIDLSLKSVKLSDGDHLKSEFLKP